MIDLQDELEATKAKNESSKFDKFLEYQRNKGKDVERLEAEV